MGFEKGAGSKGSNAGVRVLKRYSPSMPIIETPRELIPDPASLTALVAQLVEGKWPSCEAERDDLFRCLRFVSGDIFENDS